MKGKQIVLAPGEELKLVIGELTVANRVLRKAHRL